MVRVAENGAGALSHAVFDTVGGDQGSWYQLGEGDGVVGIGVWREEGEDEV